MKRLPTVRLRPFISLVWASGEVSDGGYTRPVREHVLPGGMMHLVFRLDDRPSLRILNVPDDPRATLVGGAVVGGARSRFYLREITAAPCSVGALLRPGAAECLFGVGAHELAEQHTPLDELWPRSAYQVRERLQAAAGAESRLAILEAALSARLPPASYLHPAVAAGMRELQALHPVAAAVACGDISHRQFIDRFRRAVGLNPQTWLRVLRFQHALQRLAQPRPVSLALLAADAGYSDQAHFSREFAAFTGVTPGTYRKIAPAQRNHLPVAS